MSRRCPSRSGADRVRLRSDLRQPCLHATRIAEHPRAVHAHRMHNQGLSNETLFGRLLRAFREAASLSQEELAERSQLSWRAITALERGERRKPRPRTVRMLANALNLPDQDRERLFASIPAPKPGSTAGGRR